MIISSFIHFSRTSNHHRAGNKYD